MRELEDDYDVEDLRRVIAELTRRIGVLENASGAVLSGSAPTSPSTGALWNDIEGGKLQVYNGTGYNTFSKD